VAAGLRTGDGLNAPDNEAVGPVPTSTRRGRRFSVAHGYLAPALRRRNLTLVTDATATRVVIERGRARGVEVLLDGHPETAVAEREVILAAGAVDSPKLLLLSGVGPEDELERHGVERHVTSPGVGANLQDHLACGLLCDTRGAGTLAGADRPRHLLRWLLTGKGPLASNVAEAAAFVRSDPSLPAPDLELIFAPVLFENEGLTRPTEHGITLAVIPLRPHSRGTVALASSDPRAAPLVDPCYLSDSRDLQAMLQGLRLARRVTAAEPLAGHLAREREPGADALEDADLHVHVRRRAQTLYHPVGTCRAGTDEESVVDPLLRVRGVAALRVVDASIFPLLPRGHTNWPVVAVAERAAGLVAAAA
jgi:choline dehydrogenase